MAIVIDQAKIDAARKAGYTDDEISSYLGKSYGLDSKIKSAFDTGYTATEVVDYIAAQYAPKPEVKPERTLGGTIKDIGITALKSAISVPETVVGLADLVSGGKAGKLAEDVGIKFEESKAILDSYKSDAQKAAEQRVNDADGFVDTVKTAVQNPSVIASTIGESALPMLGGGLAGRGILSVAPNLSKVVAGAAGEGLVGAGSAAESTRQQTEDGELTGKQSALAALSGAGTAAFGALGGKVASKLGIGDIDTAIVNGGVDASNKSLLRKIVEGGFSEGVLEELPQSVQEQILSNAALDKPLLEGVDNAAALGLLAGAGMGAGAQLLPSGKSNLTVSQGNPADDVTAAKLQAEFDAKQAQADTALSEITNPNISVEDSIKLAEQAINTPTSNPNDLALLNQINEAVATPEAIPASDILGGENVNDTTNATTELANETIAGSSDNLQGSVGDLPNQLAGRSDTGPIDNSTEASAQGSGSDQLNGNGIQGNDAIAILNGEDAVSRPFAQATDEFLPKMRSMTTDAKVISQIDEELKLRGIANVDTVNTPAVRVDETEKGVHVGEKINKEWTAFSPESGTLNIPRSEMPQVKAEHRGAMVNFLNARGVDHTQETVPASSLKPTQQEFSEAKVKKASKYAGGDRSILVSSDNHVLDGHHQWLSKLNKGGDVDVIRLNAPIAQLLNDVKEFPSSTVESGATTSKVQKPKSPKQYKPKTLLATLRDIGGIKLSEKQDVTGEVKGFAPGGYNQVFKQASNRSLKGLIESGDLDDYLPYNMRLESNGANDDAFDSTEAYDYLSEKIRNGESVLPYAVVEEAQANQYYQDAGATAESDVQEAAELLTEDEINEQLRQATNEERETATEARVINTERENGDTGSGERSAATTQTNASQQAEVTNSNTDLLGDNTTAKQAVADAERAKDAKRNSGNDNQDTFTLTGSNSEADQAAAAGAQDLFSAPIKQQSNTEASTGADVAENTANQSSNGQANEEASEIDYNGVRLYKIKVRNRVEGQPPTEMWAVESTENKERKARGERAIGGDNLSETLDEAKAEAELMLKREADNNQAADAQAKLEAEQKEQSRIDADKKSDIDGFGSELNAMQLGKLKETLNKQTSINGVVSPLRDAVRNLVSKGGKPEIKEENVYKGMSRAQYNRADNRAQQEDEKRIREGGKKNVYYITMPDGGMFELGKTAHDFADYLISKTDSKPQDEVTKAAEALTAAGVKGKEKLDTIKDVREGKVTAEEVADAYGEPATQKPKGNVDDFGEKLEGARKDMVRAMAKEYSDDELASLPLSKIWPITDVNLIENKTAAAIAWTAREEIPSKPRKPYALKVWVGKVKILRDIGRIVSKALEVNPELMLQKLKDAQLGQFKSKVALLEAIDRDAWKRIGKVEEYPNAYSYVDGVKQIKPMVRIDVDGVTTTYEASSVADVIDNVNEKLGKEKQEKRMAFEVRGSSKGGYFINKKGDKNYTKLKTFDSSKEAFEFLRNNYNEVVAAWDATKDRLNVKESDVRGKENRPRTGEDYRKGKDVSSEEFATTFGFRGIQFGEWVKQGGKDNDRQGALNAAYDALMDLANIVGVPPKAMSLEGTLGLSFGARGKGSAAAHFEPGNLVINLTKTQGAGTLAHEWFHALDNYFSRKRGGEKSIAEVKSQQAYREGNYITYKPEALYINKNYGNKGITKAELERYRKQSPNSKYWSEENWILDPKHPQGVRPEVEVRFADLVDALNTSPMKQRARSIDGVKEGTDGYWSRIIELGARAFENYVIHKMQLNGYDNDYLANVVRVDSFNRDSSRFPYLLDEEVAPVAEAFDNLFSEIQTKETDSGNVVMFSRIDGIAKGLPKEAIQRAVNVLRRNWKNAPEIIVVQDMSDPAIREAVREENDRQLSQGAEGQPEGFFDAGKVYIVASEMNSPDDLIRVVFHETLGHYGLRGLYGKELGGILDRVAMLRRRDMAKKAKQYGLDLTKKSDVRIIAEEVLAEMAQTAPEASFVKRAIAAIRQFLRDIGVKLELTDNDIIANYLLPARNYVTQGAQQRGLVGNLSTAFNRDNSTTTAQLFKELTLNDDMFKYPKSNATDMQEVFNEVAPGLLHIEKSKSFDDEVSELYSVYPIDASGNPIRSKVGFINVYDDGKVEINVSSLGEGFGGSGIYAAVGNWAYNNGKVFAGDREGISPAGISRRLENMISLALKFGTTDHIMPHKDQMNDLGFDWKEGDTEYNLAEMLKASFNAIRNGVYVTTDNFGIEVTEKSNDAKGVSKLDDLVYDFDKHMFMDVSNGQEYTESDFEKLARTAEARNTYAGRKTLQRAAIGNTFMGATGEGKRSLLEQLGKLSLQHLELTDPQLAGIFYSRNNATKDLPDAIILNDIGTAKADTDYDAAKSGDVEAAARLAKKLVTDEIIEKIKQSTNDADLILGVTSVEQSGNNALPEAAAVLIAEKLGVPYDENIVQSTSPKRTAMNGLDRIFNRPLFTGEVQSGAGYVFVDDTITQGGTFASLSAFIKDGGGNVVANIALTGKQYSSKIALTESALLSVRQKFGDLENEFKQSTGYGYEGLTASEARYITSGISADKFRNRIIEESKKATRREIPQDIQSENGLNNKPPQFSRTASPRNLNNEIPAETTAQKIQRIGQDKFNRFKVLQDFLVEKGLELDEAADVYLAETLMSGRISARKEDFREGQLEPLIKRTQAADLSMEQIGDFLKAQHAPEANKRARQLQNREDATAFGVSDAEAQDAMDAFKELPNFVELKSIANDWRNITEQTKKIKIDSGLLTPELVAAWESAYEMYVPVKGGDDAGMTTGTGQGLNVRVRNKQRLGHGLRDEAIIENILRDHESAITLDEKNRVGKALIRFALAAKNDDIITIDKPVKRQVLKQGETAYVVANKGIDTATFATRKEAELYIQSQVAFGETKSNFSVDQTKDPVRVMLQASPQLADNEVTVYVGGHAIRLQINDEIAAREYKNMGVEHLNAIFSAGREVNNWLSKAYTGYSPDFIFTNPIRDAIQGAITLTGNLGGVTTAKIFSNYPTAVKELVKHFKNKGSSALVNEYRAQGGSTGGAYLSDLERIGNDIQSSYNEYQGALATYKSVYEKNIANGKSAKAAHTMASLKAGSAGFKKIPIIGHFLKLMESINAITENALRVATYKTLTENGISKGRSAAQAKNLMNFNRKGEQSNAAGALYLFFNPAVQGTKLIQEALMESPYKRQAQALAGGMTAMAFTMAMMALNGDDEDKDKWNKTPDYIKDGNIVFDMFGTQFTLTLPYGYRVFWSLGNVMADATQDGANYGKLGNRVASSLFANFSPVGNPMEGENGLFQLLPTSPKMALAPGVNEDSFGRPITPKKWNHATPDSQLMNRGTQGSLYDGVSEKLNSFTGGSNFKSGVVDVSPETLKFWVKSLTGGAGQFAFDSANIVKQGAQGVSPQNLKDIPIARKFARETGVTDSRSAFWERKNEADMAADQLALAKKAHDTAAIADFINENGMLIKMSKISDRMLKMANGKRDAIGAIKLNENLTLSEKIKMINDLEDEEKKIYDKYINIFDKQSN